MPIALYDAFVPTVQQMLQSTAQILDRVGDWADGNGLAADDVAGHRLHETMLPFSFQIRSIAHHSRDAIDAVRSGGFDVMGGSPAETLPAMRALVADSLAALGSVSSAELEQAIGREVALVTPGGRVPFTAENFLLSFSLPNFFFHVTTAYALLRKQGMPLGKRDYLGALRLAV